MLFPAASSREYNGVNEYQQSVQLKTLLFESYFEYNFKSNFFRRTWVSLFFLSLASKCVPANTKSKQDYGYKNDTRKTY
jgi:hypothetical protein